MELAKRNLRHESEDEGTFMPEIVLLRRQIVKLVVRT